MDWQPIETAPLGVDILIYHLHDGDTEAVMDVAFNRGGVWIIGSSWDGAKPTHWMSLPDPPQGKNLG